MATKVFLTGGDRGGWALDDDLAQVKRSLQAIPQEVALVSSPVEAEIIHTVWPLTLRELSSAELSGKRIITHIPTDPAALLGDPFFPFYEARTTIWIAQSKGALELSRSLGLKPVEFVPYAVDTGIFSNEGERSAAVAQLRVALAAERTKGRSIIGSFQRDSEGANLSVPKLVKGPDILVEILEGLNQGGVSVTALLAGPRRHWIRDELRRRGLPFIFFGKEVAGDDYGLNNVPRTILAELYRELDVYVVSSRSEGGPRAVLEATACGSQVFSSRVGIAADILPEQALYSSVEEGVVKVSQFLINRTEGGERAGASDPARECIARRHTPAGCSPLWSAIYKQLGSHPSYYAAYAPANEGASRSSPRVPRRYLPPRVINAVRPFARALRLDRIVRALRANRERLHVSMVYEFHKPPYGGGNQFFLALREALQRLGVRVSENRFASDVDVYLLNSNWFPVERFTQFADRRALAVVHRIDGPTELVRGNGDHSPDIECFELNRRFATRTVMQSVWSFAATISRGYTPKSPTIIENGVDPRYFYPNPNTHPNHGGKLRLIASSWSDNPRKGAEIYKWMDEHLDWTRYSMTFVGRVREEFKNIAKIGPQDSAKLGAILREHDVYVTASACDPCSNALIEGLSSGLPALFLRDGGHPELVGWGGIGFASKEEIPLRLEELRRNYTSLKRLIAAPKIDEIAARYRAVLEAAKWEAGG